jgi:hypothetical protein
MIDFFVEASLLPRKVPANVLHFSYFFILEKRERILSSYCPCPDAQTNLLMQGFARTKLGAQLGQILLPQPQGNKPDTSQ